jgi:hypothetical protein
MLVRALRSVAEANPAFVRTSRSRTPVYTTARSVELLPLDATVCLWVRVVGGRAAKAVMLKD